MAFDASKYILLLGLTFVDRILAAILKESVEKRQNLEMLVLPSLQESDTISTGCGIEIATRLSVGAAAKRYKISTFLKVDMMLQTFGFSKQ